MLKWFKLISLTLVGLLSLIIITSMVIEQRQRAQAIENFSPAGKFVNVGDHQLHYLAKGNGAPTVVFESGLDSGGHWPWFKVQAEIAKTTTTVSYDRAGVLWSERGSQPKTAQAMSDDLFNMLEQAGFAKPYIIVGHSMAGLTLRPFISQHKDDIAGIVFVDVSHPEQLQRFPKAINDLNPSFPDWLISFANITGAVRTLFANTYANTQMEDLINREVNALAPRSLPAVNEELANFVAIANEANQTTSFTDIPLRIITGTSQERIKDLADKELGQTFLTIWFQLQEELLALSSDSERIIAAKSSHYIQLEQPEIVITAIEALITKSRYSK